MPIISSLDDYFSDKVLNYDTAIKRVSEIKSESKTVGLCHGVFDLLHPGHIRHLESAKSLCDYLFVSITSDNFASLSRGQGRPILPNALRAYSLASLYFVDYVVISDSEKGVEVIKALRPSYYIKGPDCIKKTREEFPGFFEEIDTIKQLGGDIKYTCDEKLSTTEIIDYIKKNC